LHFYNNHKVKGVFFKDTCVRKMLTIIIFVILSYTDTEGVRELFHRLDEDDSTEDSA